MNAILASTERDDELGGEIYRSAVFNEDAESLAELDDQSRHHGPGEIDFGEADAFALGQVAELRGTVLMGWILCHPANLPVWAVANYGANLETLTP